LQTIGDNCKDYYFDAEQSFLITGLLDSVLWGRLPLSGNLWTGVHIGNLRYEKAADFVF